MTVDYDIAKQILSDEFARLLKVETLDQGSDKSACLSITGAESISPERSPFVSRSDTLSKDFGGSRILLL